MGPEEPNSQPVSMALPLTQMVAEQLAGTRTALALLEQARPSRPDGKIMADADVSEILRV